MVKVHGDPFHACDYNAMVEGINQNGVLSGLAVSQHVAGADMSVDVATGSALVDEEKYIESSVTNLAIDASESGKHRKDTIIYDTATSAPAVIKGTSVIITSAAAPPSVTDGDILLAVVYIGDSVTEITDTYIYDGRIIVPAIKDNWTATTDPDNNDDTNSGYEIGSRWVNTAKKSFFVCVDATSGAAVWRGTYSAASTPTVTDDEAHGFTIGSQWVDTSAKLVYVCTDATAGAATWLATTPPDPLITKNISDIAADINRAVTNSVPAGLMDGWAAGLSASIFNETALSAAKGANIFNDTNLTASKLISILDDANITSAKIKSIFETGSLSVDEKRAAVLEGDQYTAADAADSVNSTFYTDDQLALAFDNTNLTAAKGASIFEDANISISRINDILDDTNLSDSKASQIIYDTAVAIRDLSSASNIIGTAEIVDDWTDNKITSRDSESTTPISVCSPYIQDINTFRPGWTIGSGTWVAETGVMKKTNSGSAGAVYTSSTYNTGTWSVKLQHESTSNVISDFCFMWVDASNMNFYKMATANVLQIVKKVSDTDTALIDPGWTSDTAWHTCKATRDASGNFEMFFDGVSKGTATDTSITTANQIRQYQEHTLDENVWVDDLKVY